jgi:hypothetical protein
VCTELDQRVRNGKTGDTEAEHGNTKALPSGVPACETRYSLGIAHEARVIHSV